MGKRYEVIVYGATPGGIGAAIAAARRGRKTLLLEPSPYIGGMMTSGLGRTDISSLNAAGAIYREFAEKVIAYYTEHYGEGSQQVEACHGGMFFEPSLAKSLFTEMISAEPLLDVFCNCELLSADVRESRIESIQIGSTKQVFRSLEAAVFIDGTYEGDLAAKAGVPYAIGRESRDHWNEEFAGKIYMNFDASKEVFPGSTGEGDHRVQAFNFRLCLTDVADNRVEVSKPLVYNREEYSSLIEDVAMGRVISLKDAINILPIPNGKTDTNNHHFCMCSTDLPEENNDYLEGNYKVREMIKQRHQHYIQGLLWFLQNDGSLPEGFREDAKRWGYAKDEFVETNHFPPQIYVREARRIIGEYTFTENDARLAPGLERAPIQADSIAVGSYAIDSHATRKREQAGKDLALEGFLGLGWLTKTYQIPYGIMVPRQIDGLLVPVAVSATHMGFGTIRMEPCWMQLGFAAGIAADLCIQQNIELRNINVDLLQDELLSQNQLITFFADSEPSTLMGQACQYFGTKGFFTSYQANSAQPITVAEASQLIALSRSLMGGRQIPVLPATDRILQVGIDMGPRLPREETSPGVYWTQQILLPRHMAKQWLNACKSALLTDLTDVKHQDDLEVTCGEFCSWLYILLKKNRVKMYAAQQQF